MDISSIEMKNEYGKWNNQLNQGNRYLSASVFNIETSTVEDPEITIPPNHQYNPALINTLNDSFSFCNKLNKSCQSNNDCSNDSFHNCSICWSDNSKGNNFKICGPRIDLDENEESGRASISFMLPNI